VEAGFFVGAKGLGTMKNDEQSPAKHWRPETALVHAGITRSQWNETAEALFLTQGYVYKSAEQAEARFKGEDPGHQYTRYSNPTTSMFEDRLKIFEGAEACRVTASGMAAVTASTLGYLKSGDHVVAARAMFGSCRNVIENIGGRFGITSTMIDGKNLDAWREAIRPNTKLFFFETPSNPNIELVDIAGVCKIAHEHNIIVIVDNVFATPMLQRPLALGADVVVYSATKHIDGQGRCLGGAVLGSTDFIVRHIQDWLRQTGPSLSPFNSWVLLKSLETMPIRIRQQCANAAKIADFLAEQKAVSRVLYPGRADHPQAALAAKQMPGGGQMIAFEIKGGKPAAFRFLNALNMIIISNNLGDTKSIVTHPATTTHSKITQAQRDELGISDGMIRLSIGLEAAEDIADDLTHALNAAHG
jgi:O-succinylhomoserine sulfhydrylase